MNEETKISEKDKASMDRLGITCTAKQVYFYKQHRYNNLTDAVRYAERKSASTQIPK